MGNCVPKRKKDQQKGEKISSRTNFAKNSKKPTISSKNNFIPNVIT